MNANVAFWASAAVAIAAIACATAYEMASENRENARMLSACVASGGNYSYSMGRPVCDHPITK
jgi:hypothetical protein